MPDLSRRDDPELLGLRRAFLCGLLPLGTGLGILALWMATRWNALPLLGLLTLIVGAVVLMAGALNLRAARGADPRRRRAALLLLWANLPAAAFSLWAAADVMTSFTVTVRNDGPRTLREVVVAGPALRQLVGALEPGESATVRIRPRDPAALDVQWRTDAGWESAGAEFYVADGLEGHVQVVVPAQGAAIVHHGAKALGWLQAATR